MSQNIAGLEQATKRYAEKVVLDGVTLGIDAGDRVGVIGRNGSGKSTLLRLLAGVEEPDAGRVVRAGDLRVHYLGQDPRLDPAASALALVLSGDTPIAGTARAFERAAAALRAAPADPAAQERLEEASREMDAAGAWDFEHRARAVLDRLDITEVDRPVGQLSGGQRKRVALARALVETESTLGAGGGESLLILDEPTNHLDVDVVEWLEGRLADWTGALMIVTHDRYLLDRVATRIIEVHDGRLDAHAGSYGDYLEAREVRAAQAAAGERRRSNRARTELAWLRRGPKARTSKAKARVSQARAVIEDVPEAHREDVEIDLPGRRLGGKVVNLHNAGKRYGDRWVLRNVDLKLKPGDRLGLVGPNGSGKTTLLRLVGGCHEPDEGSVRSGDTVHVGYFGQDPRPLPANQRVLDAVREVVRETQLTSGVRVTGAQLLERFLFDADAQKAHVGELSGGERRRLELLLALADAPNLLLLDEPTNDLDLDTLGVLEEYLDAWKGVLVVASHDRFFLDRVCEHLYSLETDGAIRHHPGGWSAYRAAQREQVAERRRSRSAVPSGPAQPRPDGSRPDPSRPERSGVRPGKLSYNERRELALLEERLPQLAARRDELSGAVQTDDYAAAAAAGEELSAVLAELDAAETRWLELAAAREAESG